MSPGDTAYYCFPDPTRALNVRKCRLIGTFGFLGPCWMVIHTDDLFRRDGDWVIVPEAMLRETQEDALAVAREWIESHPGLRVLVPWKLRYLPKV